jgi:hypothetical protein
MDPALHPLLATPLHKEAYPLSKKTAKESRQKLATTKFTYKKRSGVKSCGVLTLLNKQIFFSLNFNEAKFNHRTG